MQRDHAILAALNIASELFHLQRQSGQMSRSIDAKLGSLVALIDETVNETGASSDGALDTQTITG